MLRPVQGLIRDSAGRGVGGMFGWDRFFMTAACFRPDWLANVVQSKAGVYFMSYVSQISFDDPLGSLLVCRALRQGMILALPDHMAGPGGWFIDTGTEEDA